MSTSENEEEKKNKKKKNRISYSLIGEQWKLFFQKLLSSLIHTTFVIIVVFNIVYYQKNCIENDFKVKISEFFYYNGDEENFDSVPCKDIKTKEFKESKDYNWPFSSILTKDGKVCKMINDKDKPSIGLNSARQYYITSLVSVFIYVNKTMKNYLCGDQKMKDINKEYYIKYWIVLFIPILSLLMPGIIYIPFFFAYFLSIIFYFSMIPSVFSNNYTNEISQPVTKFIVAFFGLFVNFIPSGYVFFKVLHKFYIYPIINKLGYIKDYFGEYKHALILIYGLVFVMNSVYYLEGSYAFLIIMMYLFLSINSIRIYFMGKT